MVLAKPGSITPHTNFKSTVYVLSKEKKAAVTTCARAVLQGLSSAVLLPHDGRDGRGGIAGGHRDGDAWRQRGADD